MTRVDPRGFGSDVRCLQSRKPGWAGVEAGEWSYWFVEGRAPGLHRRGRRPPYRCGGSSALEGAASVWPSPHLLTTRLVPWGCIFSGGTLQPSSPPRPILQEPGQPAAIPRGRVGNKKRVSAFLPQQSSAPAASTMQLAAAPRPAPSRRGIGCAACLRRGRPSGADRSRARESSSAGGTCRGHSPQRLVTASAFWKCHLAQGDGLSRERSPYSCC